MNAVVKRVAISSAHRTLVLSDIHGNLSFLKGLLDKVGFGANDELFILGDILEKSEFSLETLRFVMKMKKKSEVYFQMFLSYLGILVIPMILAMVLYAYTFQIIRSQAEEMNKNLLIMVKNELDYEIENLQKIASRLALDDRVQMAANVKKNFTSQDQMPNCCPENWQPIWQEDMSR